MSPGFIQPQVVRCKRCFQPIRWLTTVAGKKMPVDANREPRGTVELIGGVAHVVPPTEDPRYVPHFASCQASRTNPR